MTLKNEIELANTRAKLRELEDRYEARRRDSGGAAPNPHVRELTLQSLKRLINQLQEEIARYQAHQLTR